MKTYSKPTFKKYCDTLRSSHQSIEILHEKYGYPPYWKRENSFESLCKTIIEQQVSLASAKSSYERLKLFVGEIHPKKLVSISEEEFRANGITKQKGRYLRLLSEVVIENLDFFRSLEIADNQEAKNLLMSLKGIGHWTSNVFLMVALNRLDIYPDHDVALIKSISNECFEGEKIDNETAKLFVSQFEPYRSIACCYFYHAYIERKGIEFVP